MFDSVRVMFVLVGAFAGAGLISGEEAGAFFAVYGTDGLVSAILSGVLLTLFGTRLLLLARTADDASFWTMLFASYAPQVRAFIACFYLAVLSAMLAGTESIACVLSVPPAISSVCLAVILSLVSYRTSLLRITLFTTPCVLILSLAASLYSLVYHREMLSLSVPHLPPTPFAYFSAVKYVSYNLLLSLPALLSVRTVHRRSIFGGAVAAGMMLSLLTSALTVVVLLHKDDAAPIMLSVAKMQHDVCFYAYTAILSAALVTSALSALVGASAHLPYRLPRPLCTAVILLFCLVLSRAGFTLLIDTVLPLMSIFALPITLRLLLPVRADTRRH